MDNIEIKENSKEKDWAKCYKAVNFIEKGVCTYQDEVVYLSQETLQKCVRDIKGKPVIIKHQRGINPDNMQEHAVGYVTGAEFDEFNASFSCDFVLFDEEAKNKVASGWSVSCAYLPKAFGQGGTWHNTAYDREITELGFTHLALVPDPRYEDAKVYENAKDEEKQNSWITVKTDDGRYNPNTGEIEYFKRIWIESTIQPKAWKEWNRKAFAEYKEGDETKFDFSRTRSKITPEIQAEIKNTLKNLQKEYKFKPVAQINVMGLSEGTLGICASRTKASTVTLNPRLFSGKYTQEQWNKSVESGFHPKGTGDMIKSVLVHELGHSITVNSENKEFWNEINKIRDDYMKNITKKDINNPDFISNYARENTYEFVAEAFSQGILSKKYGKYTKQVMEQINKHFKSTYQTKLELQNEKKDKDGFEWIEGFGTGYPIDEDALNDFKEQLQNQTDENNTEKQNNNKEDEMDVNEFFSKMGELIEEKFNACKKNEMDEKEEKKKMDENQDEDELEYEGEKYSKKELVNAFKKMKQNEADAEAAKQEEKAKEEKENALGEDSYKKLEELLNSRKQDDKMDKIKIESQADRIARGREIFG